MREIVLDTETTGLDPKGGHRIIELGCLELVNHMPTGRHLHHYIDPERDIPAEATAIHGIKAADVKGKPVFAAIVAEFLAFIEDATLVIHNAEFDLAFLNAELGRLGFPAIPAGRAIDTVAMARRKFPGSPVSLDALCQRFAIDNSKRSFHGAMLDSELLADVYIELIGGRQASIELIAGPAPADHRAKRVQRPARPHAPSDDELAAHGELLKKLKSPIWLAEG
ncbi:MAG: DNA polymerase III subunit epsilon [Alphaproteobacteria bacterium]|nr:DNA polymerase III subunit epsilon [Alphaproteobacteria bacterium]